MAKKFPARKNEYNLKDIYQLLSEIKNDLKVFEAKTPYNKLLSSALELAIKKVTIAENRLSAESFIDVIYIDHLISLLDEEDSSLIRYEVNIFKNTNSELTISPYSIKIKGYSWTI